MPTLERAPTRNYHTMIMDSGRWNDFQPRPDDIVIATFPKCGTTWTQRIVDLLVHQDPAPRPVFKTSVWLDARIFAPLEDGLAELESQTHRRFIKSHLPFDSLPVYDTVKYIHVARDGRDAFLSWHNHVSGFTPEFKARIAAIAEEDPLLTPPPRREVPENPQLFFQPWIAQAEAGSEAEVASIQPTDRAAPTVLKAARNASSPSAAWMHRPWPRVSRLTAVGPRPRSGRSSSARASPHRLVAAKAEARQHHLVGPALVHRGDQAPREQVAARGLLRRRVGRDARHVGKALADPAAVHLRVDAPP